MSWPLLTLFVRQDILVFSVDRHTLPTPLPVLLVFQDEMAPEVLDTLPLLTDAVVDDSEGRVVAEVEVFTVPSSGEEAARSWERN